MTLAIVIIVLVALVLLAIGFISWRVRRRSGGVVATPSRARTGTRLRR